MSYKFTVDESYVTLAEVAVFNDSCEHESFTACDRCLCEWINKKCKEAAIKAVNDTIGEALNSGDGSYRP